MSLPSDGEEKHFAYPQVRRVLKVGLHPKDKRENACWYSQFWPYGHADDDPIFFLSNRWSMQVCRIDQNSESATTEVLRHFECELLDEDVKPDGSVTDEYCAATWAYIEEDQPLLLGAGDNGYVRVFDVTAGDLLTTLVGHGKGLINELVTHPKYPWIFASASSDESIRVWDLRRWQSKHESPTIMICGAGTGHRAAVMSISWHSSGRYLVSGGDDNRACIWTMPDLAPDASFWNEISPGASGRRAEQVRTIYYPHFVSSAIHANRLDCVRFYGDAIFSKAGAENKIVFWTVTGFNSLAEPPDHELAPKASEHLDTRNGFIRAITTDEQGVTKIITKDAFASCHPFQRLLEFDLQKCDITFIRFDILTPSKAYPDIHPILACGNMKSAAHFWDLEALDRGYDYSKAPQRVSTARGRRGAKRGLARTLSKGIRGGRLSQSSLGLSRSQSASASLASADDTAYSGTASRSESMDTMSNPPHPDVDPEAPPPAAAEPKEDRTRFPLKYHNVPLKKAHHRVDLSPAKPHAAVEFLPRKTALSPDGRWCVLAGETFEYVTKGRQQVQTQIGVAVILERDIPRRSGGEDVEGL